MGARPSKDTATLSSRQLLPLGLGQLFYLVLRTRKSRAQPGTFLISD